MFRTLYSGRVRVNAPTGQKFQMDHEPVMDKNGKRHLEKTKRVETYELIQSYAEECNIENILRRATNGDAEILNQVIGTYSDLTEMPKTFAEAQQTIINMKHAFEQLPKETRALFENNPEIYIAQAGTEEWCKKLGLDKKLAERQAKEAEASKLEEEKLKAIRNLANMEAFAQSKEMDVKPTKNSSSKKEVTNE